MGKFAGRVTSYSVNWLFGNMATTERARVISRRGARPRQWIWRGFVTALVLICSPATAGSSVAIKTAFDRFTFVCPLALAEPEAYIATLTIPGPAGEDATYRSGDGQYLLVHSAQSEGITDYVEVSALGLRSCRISATIPDFPEAEDIAEALLPMITSAADTVVGGRVPLITPMWDPGESPEAFDSGDWYVFHMSGLWPGDPSIATAHVELGAVTFHVGVSP